MKMKYPSLDALAVAKEIVQLIKPRCERIIIAGSLRRRKQEVGDVEIVFIPKFTMTKDLNSLFPEQIRTNDTFLAIKEMLDGKTIEKRLNENGLESWGNKNKLAVHARSGIPIDFFATDDLCWFNYLTCRTGGAENNKRIAMTANKKGWTWNPYGPGFSKMDNPNEKSVTMLSEKDVFDFVGLTYLEPWERS